MKTKKSNKLSYVAIQRQKVLKLPMTGKCFLIIIVYKLKLFCIFKLCSFDTNIKLWGSDL